MAAAASEVLKAYTEIEEKIATANRQVAAANARVESISKQYGLKK